MNIAVLVSGGVDSSVALAQLRSQGHQVTAFYLKIWLENELSFLGSCPWEEDLGYIRAVCKTLDVPLEIISLQQEYHDRIIAYVLDEVRSGKTPNPDMLCNTYIKFGLFWERFSSSFDAVATGHYAQIIKNDGIVSLVESADPIKDQTYFLGYMNKDQLARALFPIGALQKDEVRSLAQKWGLATHDRRDSQGICFLGKFKFRDFIKSHLGQKIGCIKEEETGNVLGEHHGFWFYTVGQRQNIRLSGGPWYVVRKDIIENIVYVSRSYYDAHKTRNEFFIKECNWIGKPPMQEERMQVKLRHGPQKHECFVLACEDSSMRVFLGHNDQGIASGQFAIFYRGQECIGGGIIQ